MINRLLQYLDRSTCNFLAVKTLKEALDAKGFEQLDPAASWTLKPGGKYYIEKNQSALFAFVKGTAPAEENGFHIISSHSDSPCFKIKPNPEIYGDGGVVSLNVEKYGGGIMYTWFDRPLSISGRVMLAGVDPLHPQSLLIDFKRAVATIPHLAIHFNRAVNEGNPLSVQKDMKPVVGIYSKEEIEGFKMTGGVIRNVVAQEITDLNGYPVQPQDILDYELCLYPLEPASLVGFNQPWIQSARIDDLSMAFASLEAMCQACDAPSKATRVMAVFDNEETGSGTKQGAASPTLATMLKRVCGCDDEAFARAIAHSFMISADDAHAWHPNYNDKYDPTNHPTIGGGPVIKINANCKYMTDADGSAVFQQVCKQAGVPFQYFVNHADVAGGSTLGNILTSQLDLRGVDMGDAIWAMHSARETAGVADYEMTVKAFAAFLSL